MDLRTYRRAHGLTLADVASRLRTSVANVSRWERGEVTPSLQTISDIQALTDGAVTAAAFLPPPRVETETA